MHSSISTSTIDRLKATGYLPTILRRSPVEEGKSRSASAVPAPRDGERVIFISHLVRGLGFPLNPFTQGLLFYYRLDFHHLAPSSILHIVAFIIFCKAFLHVEPHFGLWQKVFCVKPRRRGPELVQCGGAKISRLANAIWTDGSFIEIVECR